MALVYEIIADAFRESNLIATGETPTPEAQAEGLKLFNRFLISLIGGEAGDRLRSYVVGTNNINTPSLVSVYDFASPNCVPLNARLIVNNTTASTIQLDPNPTDGARLAIIDSSSNFTTAPLTVNGNGRRIEGATSITLNTSGTQKEWFYRADTANWVPVAALILTDNSPFPAEFDDLLSIGLAMRLNPRNGVTIDDVTMGIFRRLRSLFRARYQQIVPASPELGLVRLTKNTQANYGTGFRGN